MRYRLRAEKTQFRKEYFGIWHDSKVKKCFDRLVKDANRDHPDRRHWVEEEVQDESNGR